MVGGGSQVVKVTGVQHPGRTMTILIRGSNKLVLEEAERWGMMRERPCSS
jgi:T-complex protein 1 subunit delta